MDINTEIFDGKSLANLFSEIHTNTASKRAQINSFILKMVQLIRTPEDASVIGPIVQGFLEVNVKNDEHLIRVAQIAQRLMIIGGKTKDNLDSLLSEEEKQALLKDLKLEVEELSEDTRQDIDSIFADR